MLNELKLQKQEFARSADFQSLQIARQQHDVIAEMGLQALLEMDLPNVAVLAEFEEGFHRVVREFGGTEYFPEAWAREKRFRAQKIMLRPTLYGLTKVQQNKLRKEYLDIEGG